MATEEQVGPAEQKDIETFVREVLRSREHAGILIPIPGRSDLAFIIETKSYEGEATSRVVTVGLLRLNDINEMLMFSTEPFLSSYRNCDGNIGLGRIVGDSVEVGKKVGVFNGVIPAGCAEIVHVESEVVINSVEELVNLCQTVVDRYSINRVIDRICELLSVGRLVFVPCSARMAEKNQSYGLIGPLLVNDTGIQFIYVAFVDGEVTLPLCSVSFNKRGIY